jgi:hypothetical protein
VWCGSCGCVSCVGEAYTLSPAPTLGKLMSRIDQFIRVEEDGGGTALVQAVAQPMVTTSKASARSNNTTKNVAASFRAFQTVFKELIYKIMEKNHEETLLRLATKTARKPGHEG